MDYLRDAVVAVASLEIDIVSARPGIGPNVVQ